MDDQGHKSIVALLVIIALIPIITFSYFWIKRLIFRLNTKVLPDSTLTTELRLVKEIDKDGKEISYWVLDTTNHSPDTYYQCQLNLKAKGDQKEYLAFSQNFVYQDCKKLGEVRENYDCRLGNMILRWRSYDRSRIWEKITGNGHLIVAVGRFHQEQTVSSQSFLSQKQLSDMDTLTALCLTESKKPVKQIIPF